MLLVSHCSMDRKQQAAQTIRVPRLSTVRVARVILVTVRVKSAHCESEQCFGSW